MIQVRITILVLALIATPAWAGQDTTRPAPYSCRQLYDEQRKCAFGSCDKRVIDRLIKKCLRDCRHVHINPARNECLHPDATEWLPDYLNGGQSLYHPTIVEARAVGKCGHEARLWEAEDP